MKTILAILALSAGFAFGQNITNQYSGQPQYAGMQLTTTPSAGGGGGSTPMPLVMQTNLDFYVRADSVQLTNGNEVRIWNDVHNSYNTATPDHLTNNVVRNDSLLTGTNTATLITDFDGKAAVLSPWAYSAAGTSWTNFSGPTVSNTVNFTSFAVCGIKGPVGAVACIQSWGFDYLAIFGGNLGCALTFGSPSVPINKSIMVVSSSGGSIITCLNGVFTTNAATASTGASGITIGNGHNGYFFGELYQFGFINRAVSTEDMKQMVTWLAADTSARTNYTAQVYCAGDSMTEGIGSTNHASWPHQFYLSHPDVMVFNQGVSGQQIGTDTTDTFADSTFNSGLTNYFVMMKGVNDMLNGVVATNIYNRLTNYLVARKTAHPWRIIPVTLANTGAGTPSVISDYNVLIRQTNTGIYSSIADSGWNSPVETRLDNSSDLNYFFGDGLHLQNNGYAVVASHVASQIFTNAP